MGPVAATAAATLADAVAARRPLPEVEEAAARQRQGAVINASEQPVAVMIGAPDTQPPTTVTTPQEGETAAPASENAASPATGDAGALTAITTVAPSCARVARGPCWTSIRGKETRTTFGRAKGCGVTSGAWRTKKNRPSKRTMSSPSRTVGAEIAWLRTAEGQPQIAPTLRPESTVTAMATLGPSSAAATQQRSC